MKRVFYILIAATLFASVCSCAKRKKGPAYQTSQLSAQGSAACALMRDGVLRCWGSPSGELPAVMSDAASSACATDRFVCAVKNGEARCTGRGVDYAIAGARAVSCERDRACALDAAGVICRGPSGAEERWPVAGARSIFSGPDATCVVLEDGSARCFGSNADGILGDGTTEARRGLVTPAVSDVAALGVGEHHACALHTSELVSCWGRNTRGQLGDGTFTDRFTPALVPGLTGIGMIAAGGAHTCAHRKDDTIRCWGAGDHHQLGLGGEPKDQSTPALVPGLYEATAIACGAAFSCARMADGWIRCWGANESGQIGDGTLREREVPMPIRF